MLVLILKILIPFLIIFNILPLLIWAERKGSAYIQDRRGPNRAGIMGVRLGGLLHTIADVIKLLTKEDIIPAHVNKPFFILAPFLSLFVACVTYAVIPFAHPLEIGGKAFVLQSADVNVGILYILAMSSLGVFGVLLAGWSSNNKYSLLGGLRSSAQMFSYEIAVGLILLSVLLLGGSLTLSALVENQTEAVWKWNFIRQPLAGVLFITALFAENNRIPFDLPEGESELVAGYHVEYSSMKFAMFFMAEYAHMIVNSALIAVLFFGGWQVPFMSTGFLRANAETGLFVLLLAHGVLFMLIGFFLLKKFKAGKYGDRRDYEVLVFGLPLTVFGLALSLFTLLHGSFELSSAGQQIFAAVCQFGVFMLKILFFCWVFIWIRWTLPRFRYDQLMRLGWKVMIPLALANVAVTAIYLLVRYG
ncbi:MAG: NADH-quinone oxidoreductase subunit H [Deltaproteobacteria bacterium]|nr:NADH-quinone oxidoreductase subunit H [Deltaproteobacteria bacterium]